MTPSDVARQLAGSPLLTDIYRSVEPAWPHEGCGFVFETADGVLHNLPTRNNAQRLHELDPERYPRGGGDWFEPDMKPWLRAVRAGEIPRVIYHSHPEVGAYFSDSDVASALAQDGEGNLTERNPGVVHLVVSVRQGSADEAALFAFDHASGIFEEIARFDADGRLDLA